MSVKSTRPIVSEFEPTHASVHSYIVGFSMCILLTLLAYMTAVNHWFSRREAMLIISLLAAVQCFVQLTKFLHLGQEFKPRYKLLVFSLMLIIVAIFVGGSLWIMDNLNYRMMESPTRMNQYMKSQDGL